MPFQQFSHCLSHCYLCFIVFFFLVTLGVHINVFLMTYSLLWILLAKFEVLSKNKFPCCNYENCRTMKNCLGGMVHDDAFFILSCVPMLTLSTIVVTTHTKHENTLNDTPCPNQNGHSLTMKTRIQAQHFHTTKCKN